MRVKRQSQEPNQHERRSRGNNAALLSQNAIFPVSRKGLRCSFHKVTTYLYNAVRHGCDSVSPLNCLCGSNGLQRVKKGRVEKRRGCLSREFTHFVAQKERARRQELSTSSSADPSKKGWKVAYRFRDDVPRPSSPKMSCKCRRIRGTFVRASSNIPRSVNDE